MVVCAVCLCVCVRTQHAHLHPHSYRCLVNSSPPTETRGQGYGYGCQWMTRLFGWCAWGDGRLVFARIMRLLVVVGSTCPQCIGRALPGLFNFVLFHMPATRALTRRHARVPDSGLSASLHKSILIMLV